MVPVELEPTDEQLDNPSETQESRFFTCHVCGDNWLTVKQTELSGECQITFVHQMGLQPTLKRVAHLQTSVLLQDSAVQEWEYFLGDEAIEEDLWMTRLNGRRKILKSICSN